MKKILFIAAITFLLMGTSYAQEPELVLTNITEDVVADTVGTVLQLSDTAMSADMVAEIKAKYGNTYMYCEIFQIKKRRRGVDKLGEKSWAAAINIGFDKKPIYITNGEGRILGFDNKIGILNYMSADGWELVEIYTIVSGMNGSTDSKACYIMRKKVSDLSQSEIELYDKYILRP